jgi:hypothetical protein
MNGIYSVGKKRLFRIGGGQPGIGCNKERKFGIIGLD